MTQQNFDFDPKRPAKGPERGSGPSHIGDILEDIMLRVRPLGSADIMTLDDACRCLATSSKEGRRYEAEGRRGALGVVLTELSNCGNINDLPEAKFALTSCINFDPDPEIRIDAINRTLQLKPPSVAFELVRDGISSALDPHSTSFDLNIAYQALDLIIRMQLEGAWTNRRLATYFESQALTIFENIYTKSDPTNDEIKVAERCGVILTEFKTPKYKEHVIDILQNRAAPHLLIGRAALSASPEGFNLRDQISNLVSLLDIAEPDSTVVSHIRLALRFFSSGFVRSFNQTNPGSIIAEEEVSAMRNYFRNY